MERGSEIIIHELPPEFTRIDARAIGKRFTVCKKEGNNLMLIIPQEFLGNLFEIIENKVLGLAFSCVYLNSKFCKEV